MLTELINFSNSLSDDFKAIGQRPKEGLHILLKLDDNAQVLTKIEADQIAYYDKKVADLNPLLQKCMLLQDNAWCIDTNKCFDLPQKAIHSCSPYCIAFKREHLKGGEKYKANEERGKTQLYARLDSYFAKAKGLLPENNPELLSAADSFARLFCSGKWESLLDEILEQRNREFEKDLEKLQGLQESLKEIKDKSEKAIVKERIETLKDKMSFDVPLMDASYILFYLDLSLDSYKEAHGKYLSDKLFNTAEYNIQPDKDGPVFGTNNFQNGYNSKMPFLLHRTAAFDISGRITADDARSLFELSKVLPRKSLPNPLPIFIYGDEFKQLVVSLYADGKKAFQEVVNDLYDNHAEDFQNYYLLNWSNTQNGIVFNDFDYVSRFIYRLGGQDGLKVENHFKLYEKKGQQKVYPQIKTIFELEAYVLKYLIQNKYHNVDYFSDFKKEDYESREMTFLSFSKYRKAVYDYVYKSKQYAIGGKEFDEMIFNGIQDDVKNAKDWDIKEKLNLWYSLYEYFHKSQINNSITMASKLKAYQKFVEDLLQDSNDTTQASDEEFAFAAGQVIYYLIQKSKSEDKGLRLVEPYLQKSSCKALQEKIVEDFERYKHELFSKSFRRVSAFVLSYETDVNIKTLRPQILSGLFAENQLYSNPKNNPEKLY